MIKVEHLSKTFQINKQDCRAVQDISFEVSQGEIFGILGPNGAGKTTLLRMLGGILTPTSGTIEVNGIPYSTQEKEIEIAKGNPKEFIGYLSGNTRLYGKLTPRELLIMWGKLYQMNREEINNNLKLVTNTLNLESFLDSRIENLSTGQTQRTSIARCLIHRPKVYIFDEPTLGLDIISSHGILEFMKREKAEGRTVLYSTHYMEEAETLCDRILLMYKGKLVDIGTTQELKERWKTDNLRDTFIALAKEEGELL